MIYDDNINNSNENNNKTLFFIFYLHFSIFLVLYCHSGSLLPGSMYIYVD